jgi:probable rRNA maturation factor
LSILIIDDNKIAKLNKKFLNREGPTNVIAFPMEDGSFKKGGILGDVVISIETAEREGRDLGIGIMQRFNELLIHGILHLLGYDHEKNRYQADKMRKKTAELMMKVNSE